ncbi:UDP-4-amino-4,6-dideoxy-N-acetyl-beta-L-altrosamine transaminase [Exiguobacterium aurantiacum]|uniref:UDP-4-amino-4, 6-dideoxy-N-acetyl-beta-L-altrosamine transaminase n=1 Tax=Exiguobacterium aurantiacum TaxID=33987 RepID=UPI00384BCC61
MIDQPVRNTFLPYGRQWIEEDDIQAVVDTLRGDFLTTGPAVDAFEQAIAQYVGARYAVSFSNGTAALHGACFAAGIGEGDEVITTPMTFAASANCVLYQNGTPVFADIDPMTYNLDPEAVERAITPRTKAIIPVHFTGQPAAMQEIHRIAKQYGLVVIEDAAHALGATYRGKRIGGLSDMTMFSFHPVKHITSGEGGIITTNDETYYQKLLQFRTHGITKNTDQLTDIHGPWYYEMQFLGFNYRMTDIQAVLGTSQLKKIERFIELRKMYVSEYDQAFRDVPEIEIPYQDESGESSWHLYIIRLNLDKLKVSRKEVFKALLSENIGVNVHYIPVYWMPYYQELGYERGISPNAEALYEEMITLPLFPAMTAEDVYDVIEAVKKVMKRYGK